MTTTYTFDQLKEDVRKEAEALRAHATEAELGRLDIESFNPHYSDNCIYGLIGRGCRSERAIELIRKCCKAYIKNSFFRPVTGDTNFGHAYASPSEAYDNTSLRFLSSIEAYILLPEAKNKNLIAFLKGETDNLEL